MDNNDSVRHMDVADLPEYFGKDAETVRGMLIEAMIARAKADGFKSRTGDGAVIKGMGPQLAGDDTELSVYWKFTTFCNYRCSYCFEHDSNYENAFSDIEDIKKAIRHIASSNRKQYSVIMSGGEPTAHPYFTETLRAFNDILGDRLRYVEIITNGSFGEKLIEAVRSLGAEMNLHIIMSCHMEYVRLEQIRKIVAELSGSAYLSFSVMLHPEKIDETKSVVDMLTGLRRDYWFDMSIMYLSEAGEYNLNDMRDRRYRQEHIEYEKAATARFEAAANKGAAQPACVRERNLKNEYGARLYYLETERDGKRERHENLTVKDLRKLTDFNFFGMNCLCGVNSIRILPDGTCNTSICRFGKANVNIFRENPFLYEDWIHVVKCGKKGCLSACDYLIPKTDEDGEARLMEERARNKQRALMNEYGKTS